MNLPKSFTTVTTFSKLLALLLFILFPVVGFSLGIEYQKSLDPLQGADPRTQLFQTKEECESFTDRKCIPTVCENNPTMPCVLEWFATRQPLTPDIKQSGDTSKCDQQGGTWDAEHNDARELIRQHVNKLVEHMMNVPHHVDTIRMQKCVPSCVLAFVRFQNDIWPVMNKYY